MILVVDASVFVKWFVDEDHTDIAEKLIDRRFELHAPELVLPEFAGVLLKKCRNGDIDKEVADAALESLRSFRITLHPHADLMRPAFKGAHTTGQSIYDWIYLSLAILLDCKFITADRRFFLGMRNTPHKRWLSWIEEIPTLLD
jgi:predicted nucleic acid-binding protein